MTKKKNQSNSKTVNGKKSMSRKHRSTFMLTEEENSAIAMYCKKYKVSNKSKFMREAVLRTVMEKFLDDYPTLFEKEDLDDLIV